MVVVDKGVLVAAIEFKSQVGPSFGNNYNNRTEEAIGSAIDVRRAYDSGMFGDVKPWLGYFFVLEETLKSTSPVKRTSSRFEQDPIFENTSYKERYEIFCQRLVSDGLYDAACLLMSSSDPESPIRESKSELSFANFAASIAGRAAYVKTLPGAPAQS